MHFVHLRSANACALPVHCNLSEFVIDLHKATGVSVDEAVRATRSLCNSSSALITIENKSVTEIATALEKLLDKYKLYIVRILSSLSDYLMAN